MGEQWVAYQDELGYRAGRIGRGVEAEVAAMAGEADAERHLARRRRGGEVAHGGRRRWGGGPFPFSTEDELVLWGVSALPAETIEEIGRSITVWIGFVKVSLQIDIKPFLLSYSSFHNISIIFCSWPDQNTPLIIVGYSFAISISCLHELNLSSVCCCWKRRLKTWALPAPVAAADVVPADDAPLLSKTSSERPFYGNNWCTTRRIRRIQPTLLPPPCGRYQWSAGRVQLILFNRTKGYFGQVKCEKGRNHVKWRIWKNNGLALVGSDFLTNPIRGVAFERNPLLAVVECPISRNNTYSTYFEFHWEENVFFKKNVLFVTICQ